MASLSIPVSLSNNTIADANQVMQNFNQIATHANANLVNIDGSVKAGTLAIENGAITNAKIDYTSVPKVTVSSTEPVGPKAGDIWVQI